MKKIVAGLTALVLTFSAMAQDQAAQSRNMERGQKREMMEELNLTPDQREKMKAINQDFKKQMEELNSQGLSESDKMDKKKTLMQARKEQTAALLTDEQKKKWESAKHDHEGMEGTRDNKFEEMSKDLNLSADQQKKFAQAQDDFKSKMKDFKANTSMDAETKSKQMESLKQNHKAAIEAILTKDQLEKMKAMKSQNRHNDGDKK